MGKCLIIYVSEWVTLVDASLSVKYFGLTREFKFFQNKYTSTKILMMKNLIECKTVERGSTLTIFVFYMPVHAPSDYILYLQCAGYAARTTS